jgi:hypothetical protein
MLNNITKDIFSVTFKSYAVPVQQKERSYFSLSQQDKCEIPLGQHIIRYLLIFPMHIYRYKKEG